MNEADVAARVAQQIPKTEPEIPKEVKPPQGPSAFDSNVELRDPVQSLALADYFHLSRYDRASEDAQRSLRDVYAWAAQQVQSTELSEILRLIQAIERELGITYKEDRLNRLVRFVRLQKESEVLRMQMEALRG